MIIEAANPLNASALIFPALECIHIAGFALAIGTIAIVDFRLLGLGMRRQTAAELGKDVGLWTLFGLGLVLLTGPVMFATDPDMYYLNRAFQLKMVMLLIAIIFNYTIHRTVVSSGGSGPASKVVACVSLAMWVGVITGGLFIGFV
jgi:hypothetical protein